jgi:hypothetical protein
MLSLAQIQLQDSHKNVKVTVSGFLDPGTDDSYLTVLNMDELSGNPKGVRLDNLLWVIEEKATLYLCWGERVIMPMESRNAIRFDAPLNSPSDVREIKVFCRKSVAGSLAGAFFLVLDLDKQ